MNKKTKFLSACLCLIILSLTFFSIPVNAAYGTKPDPNNEILISEVLFSHDSFVDFTRDHPGVSIPYGSSSTDSYYVDVSGKDYLIFDCRSKVGRSGTWARNLTGVVTMTAYDEANNKLFSISNQNSIFSYDGNIIYYEDNGRLTETSYISRPVQNIIVDVRNVSGNIRFDCYASQNHAEYSNYIYCSGYYKSLKYDINYNINTPENASVLSEQTMDSQTVFRDNQIQLQKNIFQIENYVFFCWNTKSDGSGESYINEELVTNIAGDNNQITLYAQWVKESAAQLTHKCTGNKNEKGGCYTKLHSVHVHDGNQYVRGDCYNEVKEEHYCRGTLRYYPIKTEPSRNRVFMVAKCTICGTVVSEGCWVKLNESNDLSFRNTTTYANEDPDRFLTPDVYNEDLIVDGFRCGNKWYEYKCTCDKQEGISYPDEDNISYAKDCGLYSGAGIADINIDLEISEDKTSHIVKFTPDFKFPCTIKSYTVHNTFETVSCDDVKRKVNVYGAGMYTVTIEYLDYYNNELLSKDFTIEIPKLNNTYTIIFDGNGASGTMQPQIVDFNEETYLSPNVFTIDHTDFVGWNTEKTGKGDSFVNESKISNLSYPGGAVTLFADWNEHNKEVKIENLILPNCTENGSYDEVLYCTDCNEELSRENKTINALGHIPGASVKENEVTSSCEGEGSYDMVVYCEKCGDELSREHATIPALGHDYIASITFPTTSVPGYTTYTCRRCNDTYIVNEIKVLGDTVEEVIYQSTDDEDFSNQTSVFAQIGSEYKVTIPKAIILSGINKEGSYIVKVEGDIAGYEFIDVVPDNTVKLTSANKADEIATISQDKTLWKISDFNVNANGKISAKNLTSGKWEGNFNFNINFEQDENLLDW